MFSKREWAKRANPCAPWWLLKSTESSHGAMKVIFICCFRDARGLLSRERDIFRLQTFEVWQQLKQLSHERFKLLTCNNAHSIVLFPLPVEALSCKLVEQGWSLLNMRQTEKYGKSSGQDLPELFYSFFSTGKGENTPSAVCVNYLMSW